MKSRPTVMSLVLLNDWMRRPWRRRGGLLAAAVLFAALAIWPKPYLARAQIMPEDSAGGLASLLGGAGGAGGGLLGSLLGGRQSIDSDLAIARSQKVAAEVSERLRRAYEGRRGTPRLEPAVIRRKVDIEAVRGGIIQISARDHDPILTKTLVETYVLAIQARLTDLNRELAAEKKSVALNRMALAASELSAAQAALDQYRQVNHLAAPEAQLGPAVSLVTGLQARLQSEEAQLQALGAFATETNVQVQAARARVAAIRGQLAAAQARVRDNAGPSLGAMTPTLNEYANLYRAEKYAEAEYDLYKRYLDTVSLGEVSAGINMEILEPAYLDPDLQFNTRFAGAFLLVLLVAVLSEVYIARPPVGVSRTST